MERRLVDINELSEYLGISKHTLYTWVSQRRIPYVKVGRLTKFDLGEIDEWIDNLPGVDVTSAKKHAVERG
jgi:excisionase family DNA binding protein